MWGFLWLSRLLYSKKLKTYDFEEDICKIIKILKDRKIIISAIRPKTKESILVDKRIKSLAPKTINGIIDSIIIPLRWVFNENYTENICYEGLRRKTTKSKERHILTMAQAEELFHGDYLKSCKNGEERDIPIQISNELRDELMLQPQMNPGRLLWPRRISLLMDIRVLWRQRRLVLRRFQ